MAGGQECPPHTSKNETRFAGRHERLQTRSGPSGLHHLSVSFGPETLQNFTLILLFADKRLFDAR